jgi:hypothetical protein
MPATISASALDTNLVPGRKDKVITLTLTSTYSGGMNVDLSSHFKNKVIGAVCLNSQGWGFELSCTTTGKPASCYLISRIVNSTLDDNTAMPETPSAISLTGITVQFLVIGN